MQFNLVEDTTGTQLLLLLIVLPPLGILDGPSCLDVSVSVGGLDHDTSFLTLPHMLDGAPQTVRHLRVTQNHLERLWLVQEYFTFLNLIIFVDFSISADTRSSCSPRHVPILFKCLSLAYLTVFTNDVDLDTAYIFIKDTLFLNLFRLLLLFSLFLFFLSGGSIALLLIFFVLFTILFLLFLFSSSNLLVLGLTLIFYRLL